MRGFMATMKYTFSTAILLVVLVSFALSLDENGAKETSCFETPSYKGMDWNWMGSIKKWYFPFWSKLELYRTASDLLNMKVDDIPESSLPYFCLTSDDKLVVSGLNKTVAYKSEPSKTMRFWFMAPDNPYGKAGMHSILYSDNKNYVIGVTCWEDIQQSWALWSLRPTLSDDLKKQAFKVLKDAGYKMDFVMKVNYDDKCPNV